MLHALPRSGDRHRTGGYEVQIYMQAVSTFLRYISSAGLTFPTVTQVSPYVALDMMRPPATYSTTSTSVHQRQKEQSHSTYQVRAIQGRSCDYSSCSGSCADIARMQSWKIPSSVASSRCCTQWWHCRQLIMHHSEKLQKSPCS